MYEIHAQYNWMFPLHMLFFHIISIYIYGLTPVRNKEMLAFPVPAQFLFAYWMFPLHLSVRTWLREQETSCYREGKHALVFDIDIFVNCIWVDTRWQYTFTRNT
jgi:hypothetical protein